MNVKLLLDFNKSNFNFVQFKIIKKTISAFFHILGTCSCMEGYGASDCSLDINKPPRLQEILHKGLCDENVTECTHVYLFGEVFVGTNLTCKLQRFTVRY